MASMDESPAETLAGLRILVVEDRYLIADEIRNVLTRRGAEVVGPVPALRPALDLIRRESLDAAVLDIELGGEDVFPAAAELAERRIPFVFATGYEGWVLPSTWRGVERVGKPFDMGALETALQRVVRRTESPA